MSWWSRILDGAVNAMSGKPVTQPIVDKPTTTMEHALNTVGAIVLPAAAMIPGASSAAPAIEAVQQIVSDSTHPASGVLQSLPAVAGASVANTVNGFLQKEVGDVGTQTTDAMLQGLASYALSKMSTNSSKTVQEIDGGLEQFMAGFTAAAQPSPPNPAPNGEQAAD